VVGRNDYVSRIARACAFLRVVGVHDRQRVGQELELAPGGALNLPLDLETATRAPQRTGDGANRGDNGLERFRRGKGWRCHKTQRRANDCYKEHSNSLHR
jgi:hypothetical protein